MTTLNQRNFSGGELAPSLYSRVDNVKYQTGLRTLRNMYVMRSGGATNRPGTEYVGEVKDSDKVTRLLKFVFNADQTYILEFGDLYMRVIQDGAYLTDSTKNISAITKATPAVVTATAHGFSNGQEVYISGVTGMTQVNGRNFVIANVTTNTFELTGSGSDSSAYGAYVSGGTAARIYEIVSPYSDDQVFGIKYIQSADVMTLVHPDVMPQELRRSGATSWAFTDVSVSPSIAAPTSVTVSGASGTVALWAVTAISDDFEESLPQSNTVGANSVPTSGSTRTISWTDTPGAREYNIYRAVNGIYGFIGVSASSSFVDTGYTPDTTDTPPINQRLFVDIDNNPIPGDFPSTVAYIQQRLSFANSSNNPEKVWMSRTGNFHNFTVSSPLQDDDAVTFSLSGRQVNAVKHLLDLGEAILFTTGGEWTVTGDQAGIIRPTDINPKQHSYNGSNDLAPIPLSGSALYVQARGSAVRDLGFDYQIDGYRGNDLTIFSSHLFDGYELVDWDYQQIPHSIVWAARDDGVLLGLTYIKEQQILGWHHHDFNGIVESVTVVPEGGEDFLYLIIKRSVGISDIRYVERLSTRQILDVQEAIFMDSALSYDGRNTNDAHTMTLSGGVTWAYDETLTLTSNTAFFTAGDIGNEIHLTLYALGTTNVLDVIRLRIVGFTSTTVVSVKPHKTVPADDADLTDIAIWTRAVDTVTGLWHIEGQLVSILGDGFVIASPNNGSYTPIAVSDGTINLDICYGVIHVGLPVTADLETLDIDTEQAETMVNKKKRVGAVTMLVESSRGIFAGAAAPTDDDTDPLEGLTELKIRYQEGYDDPVALQTGPVDIVIRPEWNSNGRVFVRQVDPLPLTILSVAADGNFPIRGAGT